MSSSSPQLVIQRFAIEQHRFLLRQLTADDAAIYLKFFNQLDPPTIRCRYGHMVSQLTIDTAQQIASLDPTWEPALAIFSADESKIVALGRFHTDEARQSAEISIVVDTTMRRLGLGRVLLESLIDQARHRGIIRLHAYVVTKNAPVQKLLRTFGFLTNEPEPAFYSEDDDIKFTLQLNS